ncbi:MAG TPA: FAD-dependent thymidylate synthase [Clostridia bacterium]|nr:FAD-dependent thymidylate synthase [Clostridia bacterium]
MAPFQSTGAHSTIAASIPDPKAQMQYDMNVKNENPEKIESLTQVFAVAGAEPEVQAYAMAKYSRSSLSMKQSLAELNEQKAEKFLDTFYFQYGHRSIADLAHVAMAIERLSLLAATIVVDEQRWDGQERSTRYQDFKKSGYYTPALGGDAELRRQYIEAIEQLFAEYREFSELMFRHLAERTPRPAEMKEDAYERTLRARAFDLSRYLLPMATNTSLGQIVNARTLETQVSRMLSHTHAEVRQLAEMLKQAGRGAAYNVNQDAWTKLVEAIEAKDANLGDTARSLLLKPTRVAPTLVKYAEISRYETETRKALCQAAEELMKGAAIASATAVDLLEDDPLELELATTLLYEHSRYSYRQVREAVSSLTDAQRSEIVDLGMRHRGRHDELLRAFCVGQRFRFDILMDIGGYRDMHRHRRCTQIAQAYSFAHGFDTPAEVEDAGHSARYAEVMQRVSDAAHRIAAKLAEIGAETEDAQYLIPLAYRKRALFKMDFAEVVYITELRTGPAGHYSYRNVAWKMYEAIAKRHPGMAKYFRVTDVREPVDLLKR